MPIRDMSINNALSGIKDNCPYCHSKREYHCEVNSGSFYRCLNCNLISKEKQESYSKVIEKYQEDYFYDYSIDQKENNRSSLFEHILDLIGKEHSNGNLLDVGTGCGNFLFAARTRGWEVKGIDPSVQSVEVAKRQFGLNVFNGTLKEYSNDVQFDVISFINVLDHSAAPWREIKRAGQLLKPGGLIYIRFPNGLLHTNIIRISSRCGLSNHIRKYLVFHQFPFTPKFIRKLLSDSYFSRITISNSPPSQGDPHHMFSAPQWAQYVKRFLYLAAIAIQILSFGKLLLGTSLQVVAMKSELF